MYFKGVKRNIVSAVLCGIMTVAITGKMQFETLSQAFAYSLAGAHSYKEFLDFLLLMLSPICLIVSAGSMVGDTLDLCGDAILSRYRRRGIWTYKQIANLMILALIFEIAKASVYIIGEKVISDVGVDAAAVSMVIWHLLYAWISAVRLLLFSNCAVMKYGSYGAYAVSVLYGVSAVVFCAFEDEPTLINYLFNPVCSDLTARFADLRNSFVFAPIAGFGAVGCLSVILVEMILLVFALAHQVDKYEPVLRSDNR